MKNIYLLLIIQLCFICSRAQGITFKCYLKSSCTDTLKLLEEYTLKKGGKYYSSLNNGATLSLPDTGVYILESASIKGNIDVAVFKNGLNIDTVKNIDIYEVLLLDSKPGIIQNGDWLCCGVLCNGFKTEYYNNGNKWFEGRFNKGRPVGAFKYYHFNGTLNYIIHYDRKGKIKNKEIKNANP